VYGVCLATSALGALSPRALIERKKMSGGASF